MTKSDRQLAQARPARLSRTAATTSFCAFFQKSPSPGKRRVFGARYARHCERSAAAQAGVFGGGRRRRWTYVGRATAPVALPLNRALEVKRGWSPARRCRRLRSLRGLLDVVGRMLREDVIRCLLGFRGGFEEEALVALQRGAPAVDVGRVVFDVLGPQA